MDTAQPSSSHMAFISGILLISELTGSNLEKDTAQPSSSYMAFISSILVILELAGSNLVRTLLNAPQVIWHLFLVFCEFQS